MVEEIALVNQETPDCSANLGVFHRPSTKYSRQLLLWIALFLCMWLIAGPLALHLSYRVPATNSRHVPAHLFSEERARDYLINLTGFGSRVMHAHGNAQARDYLFAELQRICSASQRQLRFEIERQPFVDSDQNHLQNVLVRVSDRRIPLDNQPSVLLSAHYDSVEFSPGGSDDGSGVVILLELLANLVHDPSITFANTSLIVLLTDGEEMDLQGARAFKAEHRWFRYVRRFVNVDSVACGQVANLMQIESSQLAVEYGRVRRPRTNVILQSTVLWLGIRTDYDIYALHENAAGYNFGFFLDGYTYHTPRDDISTIKAGVFQELGDNLLVLVRSLLMGNVGPVDQEPYIYFDVLGRYLIVYRVSTSLKVQRVLSAFIVAVMGVLITLDHQYHRRRSFQCRNPRCIYTHFEHPLSVRLRSIVAYSLSNLASIVIGIVFSLIVASIMSVNRPFAWFGFCTLALLLYGLPYLIGFLTANFVATRWHRSYLRKSARETFTSAQLDSISLDFEQHLSVVIVYGFMMIAFIVFPSRLFYLVLVWSIFVCPIYLMLMITEFIIHWKQRHRTVWLYAPCVVSLLPLMHTLDIVNRLVRILSPILTRRMLEEWSFYQNHLLCWIVTIPTIFIALVFVPIVSRIQCFGRVLIALSITFVMIFLTACVRQPFTSVHPNAFYAHHVARSTFQVQRPSSMPVNATLVSHSSTITMMILGGTTLSSVLDDFSTKSGHSLRNKHCFNRANCTFDDTFNRRPAIEWMSIEPTMTRFEYRVVIQHVSSSHIQISSLPAVQLHVSEESTIPRTLTTIDLLLKANVSRILIDITIRRCDLNDSPFLLLITHLMPNIIPMGDAKCQAIEDHSRLLIKDFEIKKK